MGIKRKLARMKAKISEKTIGKIAESETVQNAITGFALRTKAKASARFWPRWYIVTLCEGDYTKYNEIKRSDKIKRMHKNMLTFEMINWEDPIVELELFMCDPGNLLNLSDPDKRELTLSVLSPEAQELYYSDIPSAGSDKPYHEVILSRARVSHESKMYRKRGKTSSEEVDKLIDEEIHNQTIDADATVDVNEDNETPTDEPDVEGEDNVKTRPHE